MRRWVSRQHRLRLLKVPFNVFFGTVTARIARALLAHMTDHVCSNENYLRTLEVLL